MRLVRQNALTVCLGAVFCAGVAALLCVFTNDGWEFRLSAPIICLQTIILASLFWGRLSGLVGGLSASLTFTIWLFPPIGSLAIHDPVDRIMLVAFLLGAFVIVLLSPNKSSRLVPLGSRTDRMIWRLWDARRGRDVE